MRIFEIKLEYSYIISFLVTLEKKCKLKQADDMRIFEHSTKEEARHKLN